MQISLLDKFSFKIKGKNLSYGLGPLTKSLLKTPVDIIIAPKDGKDFFVGKTRGGPFVINAPGEYEFSGVSVFSIDNIYVAEIDEMRVCYLAKLDSELSNKLLEEIDGVDIILVPVGDDGFKVEVAVKTINKVQPRVVVCLPGSVTDKLLKELGFEETKKEKRLTVSKVNLPEEMEAVVLQIKDG